MRGCTRSAIRPTAAPAGGRKERQPAARPPRDTRRRACRCTGSSARHDVRSVLEVREMTAIDRPGSSSPRACCRYRIFPAGRERATSRRAERRQRAPPEDPIEAPTCDAPAAAAPWRARIGSPAPVSSALSHVYAWPDVAQAQNSRRCALSSPVCGQPARRELSMFGIKKREGGHLVPAFR